MDNKRLILFIPSNENHCRIFQSISVHLKEYNLVFVTQGSYKSEGTEDTLQKLGINFTRIDDYEKIDAEFILKKENVGILVIGNDSDVIPQWFVNAAKKLGIPSVLLQEGMTTDIKFMSKNLVKATFDKFTQTRPKLKMLAVQLGQRKQYKKIAYGLGECTQIHVWGKQSESYYIDKGVDKKKIIITGILRNFDFNISSQEDQEKIILYTPTDLVRMNIIKYDLARELVSNLCSVVTSIKNVRLIIKPHPREDMRLYEDLPRKFGPKVQISEEEVGKLLPISSISINDLSTVGLEALVFKKPVVIYLPNVESYAAQGVFPNELISKNIYLYAYDKQSLSEQITKILKGNWSMPEGSLDMIEKYVGPLDNKATLRSAMNIGKLLNN